MPSIRVLLRLGCWRCAARAKSCCARALHAPAGETAIASRTTARFGRCFDAVWIAEQSKEKHASDTVSCSSTWLAGAEGRGYHDFDLECARDASARGS